MRILASFEGIESFAHPAVMWYGVQAYSIAFLLCHLFAFDHPDRKIVFKVKRRAAAAIMCNVTLYFSVPQWPRRDASRYDLDNGACSFKSSFNALALSIAIGSSRVPARCLYQCFYLPVAAQLSVRRPPLMLPLL